MKQEEFEILLNADKETEHLEFKEAKTQFDFCKDSHSICGYCVALANERGGKLILGVSDKIPRKVVGTKAFRSIAKLEKDVFNQIHRKVTIEKLDYNGKRVLMLHIYSRPIGEPLQLRGRYLMRIKDSLASMTPDQIKEILNDATEDYSSKTIEGATIKDLSDKAIKELRKLLKQSGRVQKNIDSFSDKQLLIDLGLMSNNKVTIAALILLGKENTLKKYIPHAEIRFGYKINEDEIRNQDTEIYCEGYLLFYNKLLEKIDSRNITIHIPQGFRLLEKKAFEEETIREAINNGIIHRDYSESESIFIIQTQNKIIITSPGGLLKGVTIDNIMDQTKTRNKLIADVLYKCEFVEQFGNGVNLMIKNQLNLGKNPPDYSRTDRHHVVLEIDGTIKDIEFAKYVYRIAEQKQKTLNDKELIILHKIKNNEKVESEQITKNLLNLGLIEPISRSKYILSKAYYQRIDKKGEYTRLRGLDKETNKELILKHLKHHKKGYMRDFLVVLKNTPKPTINYYLRELKNEEKIELVGNRNISRGEKAAFWKIK
ncbi:MAG: ATP-binding protein [archaeon]|nr:ATP-binding protein [archaeon]